MDSTPLSEKIDADTAKVEDKRKESKVDKAEEKVKAEVKKIEDELRKHFEGKSKEASDAAVSARKDEPDTAETKTAYYKRVQNVPGIFGDNQHASELVNVPEDMVDNTSVTTSASNTTANKAAVKKAENSEGKRTPAGPMDAAVNFPPAPEAPKDSK